MKKRILILGAMVVIALAFVGCKGEKAKAIYNEPFYSLQAAYESGFITKQNLKSIANSHMNENDMVLNDEISLKVKTDYIKINPQDRMTVDDVVISNYLGTYNDCIVLMIGYSNSEYTNSFWNETIGCVKFEYENSQRISIWKNK